MDELQTSQFFFVNLLLLSITKRLASFKSSLLLKVIMTKQRSLALFIPKESNAEKRNVINYHGMLISEVIFCIQFICISLLQYIMNEWAEC